MININNYIQEIKNINSFVNNIVTYDDESDQYLKNALIILNTKYIASNFSL